MLPEERAVGALCGPLFRSALAANGPAEPALRAPCTRAAWSEGVFSALQHPLCTRFLEPRTQPAAFLHRHPAVPLPQRALRQNIPPARMQSLLAQSGARE